MAQKWLLIFILVAVCFGKCNRESSETTKHLNHRWAQLDESLLRKQYETRLIEQLKSMSAPNAALFMPSESIVTSLKKHISLVKGLKKPSIKFTQDMIVGSVDFELTNANTADESKGLLNTNDYRINGTLKFAVIPMLDLPNNQVRFAFAFSVAEIISAEIAGHNIPDSLLNSVGILISKYLTFVNGFLNSECSLSDQQQLLHVPSCIAIFPNKIGDWIDLKEVMKSDPKIHSVVAERVNLVFEIEHAAHVINPQGLFLIARLSGIAFGAGPDIFSKIEIAKVSNQTARELVISFANEILGETKPKEFRVGVSTQLPARSLEYLAAAAQLGFTSTISMPSERFDTEVRLARKPEFQCSRIQCEQEDPGKLNATKR